MEDARAFALFDEFATAIFRDFASPVELEAVIPLKARVVKELHQLGYGIFPQTSEKIEHGGEDGERPHLEYHSALLLVRLPPANSTPVAIREGTFRIFYPLLEDMLDLPDTTPSTEDREILSSFGISMRDHDAWQREWQFTEDERHALLIALENRGEMVIEIFRRHNAPCSSLTTWKKDLEIAQILLGTPEDCRFMGMLIDREVERLRYLSEDAALECGCFPPFHIESLEEWNRTNLE